MVYSLKDLYGRVGLQGPVLIGRGTRYSMVVSPGDRQWHGKPEI